MTLDILKTRVIKNKRVNQGPLAALEFLLITKDHYKKLFGFCGQNADLFL